MMNFVLHRKNFPFSVQFPKFRHNSVQRSIVWQALLSNPFKVKEFEIVFTLLFSTKCSGTRLMSAPESINAILSLSFILAAT